MERTQNKQTKFSRKAGVLLPISSLSSLYGIGTLGKEAYRFADWLKGACIRIWQVLPLLPTAYGDSPYSASATYALNYYLIDFDLLQEEGLLKKEDYAFLDWGEDARRVDYSKLFALKIPVLKKAFARFKKNSPEWQAFLAQGRYYDFALFMTLKSCFSYRPFPEWGEYAKYDEEKVTAFARKHEEELIFWQFTQFLFLRQWNTLKTYCNERGIEIMGDIPIYLAYDSVETWKYGRKLFLLDENDYPALVAGVPPDAFSEEGQLWGNPVYDWEKMKENGYAWWRARIAYSLSLFDILRIDHFRGFDRFYAVPAHSRTAREGEWLEGPKAQLFEPFRESQIIAEDLGVIDDGVKKLMRDTGYVGMKIIEFAFDGNPNNEHKPSNYTPDFVAYTGTHDNMPLVGYLREKSEEEKVLWDKDLVRECEKFGIIANVANDVARCNTVVELLFASPASVVIVPLQDLFALGKESRINLPSTVSTKNWSYRLLDGECSAYYRNKLKNLVVQYGRDGEREKEE